MEPVVSLPRVLVVFASPEGFAKQMASAIAEGCRKAGVDAVLLDLGEKKGLQNYPWFAGLRKKEKIPADLSAYSLVLIGFESGSLSESRKAFDFMESNDWKEKKAAVFCCFETRKKALAEAARLLEAKGARVLNTLALKRKGLLRQQLDELDLVRAQAFGERSANFALEHRVVKTSRKASIRGYKKEEGAESSFPEEKISPQNP